MSLEVKEVSIELAAQAANVVAPAAAANVVAQANVVAPAAAAAANVAATSAADELFVNASKEISKKMAETGITVKTLHILIKYVMEAAEQTPLKGKDQKKFALRLIKELIDNMSDSNTEKYVLLNLYESESISNTIELVVSASKGELSINNVGSCIWSCITGLTKGKC
jgi:hypothetical protein